MQQKALLRCHLDDHTHHSFLESTAIQATIQAVNIQICLATVIVHVQSIALFAS
jgi:hypothetical protein